jgi:uncharacterized protein YdaU (DUF1376 family)
MADFPAIPLFTDAYLADTRHLSLEEHGAYLLLLMLAWRSPDCCLPDDDKRLAMMLGVTPKRWSSLRVAVTGPSMFYAENGVLRQKRLTRERAFVVRQSDTQRKNAEARWKSKSLKNNDPADAVASVRDMPNECQTDAPTPTPTPTKKKEREADASPKKSDASLVREVLADVIGDDLAEDFIAHRIKLRKPMTPRAAKMIAERLRQASDPKACAEHSILKGWQDVFPEKFQGSSRPQPGFQPAQSDWLPKEIIR